MRRLPAATCGEASRCRVSKSRSWVGRNARHQQHRRLDRPGAIPAVDALPVFIGFRMTQPVVEERDVADGAIIGFDEWEPGIAPLELFERRVLVLLPAAAHRPEQRGLEGKRIAGMEHLAKARARNLDDERRRSRRLLIGDDPLGVAKCRAAPHPEPPVEPGLDGQPLQRVLPVLPLMAKRIELAPRFVPPPRPLDHHGIAAARPEWADDLGGKAILERAGEGDPHQDSGSLSGKPRPVDVGHERDAVGGLELDALLYLDAVLRVADARLRQDEVPHHLRQHEVPHHRAAAADRDDSEDGDPQPTSEAMRPHESRVPSRA